MIAAASLQATILVYDLTSTGYVHSTGKTFPVTSFGKMVAQAGVNNVYFISAVSLRGQKLYSISSSRTSPGAYNYAVASNGRKITVYGRVKEYAIGESGKFDVTYAVGTNVTFKVYKNEWAHEPKVYVGMAKSFKFDFIYEEQNKAVFNESATRSRNDDGMTPEAFVAYYRQILEKQGYVYLPQ